MEYRQVITLLRRGEGNPLDELTSSGPLMTGLIYFGKWFSDLKKMLENNKITIIAFFYNTKSICFSIRCIFQAFTLKEKRNENMTHLKIFLRM